MEIINFFNTYINSINGIRAIIGVVELLVLAGVAIFAYRCFNRVVNIDISEKKVYGSINRKYAILSVSINNISRVFLARPVVVITSIVYKRSLLNYLEKKGIDSIGELVPVIYIDKLDKDKFELFLRNAIEIKNKLENYFKIKPIRVRPVFFRLRKKVLLREFIKRRLKENNKIRFKKDWKFLTEELYSVYDVLCEYVKQFKLEEDKLEDFFQYIVSVKSERILRTSKRIIPNENITIDRFYIFHRADFMHLGAQLRFGRIKKERRTSTTFVGL